MSRINRQWVVAARPEGPPRPADFDYRETAVPQPAEGELLLETRYLSLAPVMAMYMSGAPIAGRPPLEIGDVIHGRGVGRVIESRHPDYQPGDILHGQFGWQSYKVTNLPADDRFHRFTATDLPAHLALGALGMTGFSAYCGFVDVGEPEAGKPVLVSGAAGGVGHLVVQIARCLGCSPVVGIAGGPEKCALLRELGCDHALDYWAGPLDDDLARLFPDGVHLYFDNVGGEMLESVLEHLGNRARIVLCGSISEYTRDEPFGPRNYTRLRRTDASMRGFYVYNHAAGFANAEARMADWIRAGKLRPVQHIIDGFEKMPAALIGLYEGSNTGKQVVRVAAEREE
ncbi:MAG: NADP-dependent oxidoreductase [Gammaproteobacteria bacterium]|nr:NADP-dependent oxidoreductase [Gammaproteobacteria bacterium]